MRVGDVIAALSMALIIIIFLSLVTIFSFIVWNRLGLPEGPVRLELALVGVLLVFAGITGIVWVYLKFPPIAMLSLTIKSLPGEVAALIGVYRPPSRCTSTFKIVVEGPYRCTRHPLYSSALLVFTGLGLIKHPFLLASALLYAGYMVIATAEERYLELVTCGEYSRAMKGVPRLSPFSMLLCLIRIVKPSGAPRRA